MLQILTSKNVLKKISEMDLLWKKETNGASSYVDIFASIDENSVVEMLQNLKLGIAAGLNKKNNQLSTKYRLEGNAKFTDRNWRRAMVFYNLSLRFAEIGTENVGLAYANRSNCFLKLEMFGKCITDIEMALLANYPKEKKSKLQERRAYCLQQIEIKKPNEKGEKPINEQLFIHERVPNYEYFIQFEQVHQNWIFQLQMIFTRAWQTSWR